MINLRLSVSRKLYALVVRIDYLHPLLVAAY
jgi:hypothetical protein